MPRRVYTPRPFVKRLCRNASRGRCRSERHWGPASDHSLLRSGFASYQAVPPLGTLAFVGERTIGHYKTNKKAPKTRSFARHSPSAMSTEAPLTREDIQAILDQWKARNGPSPEEQAQFEEGVIADLKDPEKVKGYEANVEQVGVWANQVDESFGNVTRGLDDMVKRYGSKFPELAGFRDEWNGYNALWVSHLILSRDVASEQVAILRRFDKVFLDIVESIVTDQDRLDAIEELQNFIDEDHGNSEKMARGFYDLRKNIGGFLIRFDAYVKAKGAELKEQAKELTKEISSLQSTIEDLNWGIASAVIALVGAYVGAATIVGLLGVFVAEATLMLLLTRRLEAETKLRKAQHDLAEVNAMQQALAHIVTQFDGLKPDISLICEKLQLFGDIWQNIRSDSIRFQSHLKRGLDAVNDASFRREIRLARSLCQPMERGLEKYASQLENRLSRQKEV